MSAENSRTYSTDDDAESNYRAMESVPNSRAEDGASDGAGMDSDKCRHGKFSLDNELETDNESVDSNDSSSHTPAQKPKRQRRLSMSPPCKSPSPLPPEPELEPFHYDSLSDSTPRRKTGWIQASNNQLRQCCELEYRSNRRGAYFSGNIHNHGGRNDLCESGNHAET